MSREHITHYLHGLNCPIPGCGRLMTTRYGSSFGCQPCGVKVDFSGVMKGRLRLGKPHPALGLPRFNPH